MFNEFTAIFARNGYKNQRAVNERVSISDNLVDIYVVYVSDFPKVRNMNWIDFEILARKPYHNVTPTHPPRFELSLNAHSEREDALR